MDIIFICSGDCLIAVGCYWLPTNILPSCRNEIMANIDEWRKDVENKDSCKSSTTDGGSGLRTR